MTGTELINTKKRRNMGNPPLSVTYRKKWCIYIEQYNVTKVKTGCNDV